MILQIAWRNIWRNPRRTLIIMTAIVIGVWCMIVMSALSRGVAQGMVENSIATLIGDMKIMHAGYRDDPAIENRIADPAPVYKILEEILPPGSRWCGRVRTTAIAGNARHSAGVTFTGIEWEREKEISFVPGALRQGAPLEPQDPMGIVIGEALRKKMETGVGKKIVMMAQNANGEIASRSFRIKGIFQAEMTATEKEYVFVSLAAAREMLGLKEDVSEISMSLSDENAIPNVAERIASRLPEAVTVHTWRALLPFLDAYLNIMDGYIYIWYVIMFIAMGFGLVNTILMAVYERMREFGLLKALGMKPMWIVRDVLTESGLLLLLGMAAGNLAAVVSIQALAAKGIDLSSMAAGVELAGMTRIIYPLLIIKDVVAANLVTAGLGLLVSLYPAVKAARFTPVEAMRKN